LSEGSRSARTAPITSGQGADTHKEAAGCQRDQCPPGDLLSIHFQAVSPGSRVGLLIIHIPLSKAEVERAAQGVLRDLQRTCACCNEKGRREK